MSQGGYVTLVGFVAQDPKQHDTAKGRVTDLRVGTTPRVQDRVTGEWRDADTSYFTVTCWRRLGDHVRASLRKGDPVVVKGRFRSRSFEDKTGQPRTVIDISADTVGHDLNQGIANYMRQAPRPISAEGDADDEVRETPELPGGPGEMIDDEAIERFGRDLDADLDQAERAVSALNEHEDDDENASASVPF